MMFFKMLERCWPGSVFLGKGRIAISDNIISRGYLNCVSGEIFTDALYSLLLGRAPMMQAVNITTRSCEAEYLAMS
ncbi:hypothetical protein CTI14_02195 [Methylobacterium radiotolerans]|nr:hypothetical protein CTI14_02195 [Methylobacterium radiotolerans]